VAAAKVKMRNTHTIAWSTAVILFLTASPLRAAIIYPVVSDHVEFDNFFDGEAGGYWSTGYLAASYITNASPIPPFTGNFSTDHTLIIRLAAPDGQKFVLTNPGQTHFRFNVNEGTPPAEYTPTLASWTFNGLEGSAPPVPAAGTSMGELRGSGTPNFNFHGSLSDFGNSFSFTSMDIALAIPSGFNATFDNAPFTGGDFIFENFNATDQGTNWISLQPTAVPEPSSFALVGAVVGGAWWKRRRRCGIGA
jgi:hypothetical protein